MEIDLGGFDAVVAEKFLDLGDAGSACQEIGGEAVAQGVGGDALVNPGFAGGELEGFAEGVFVDVVPADDVRAWIGAFAGGWPEPEPGPFTAAVGVFALHAIGEIDRHGTGGAVAIVEDADAVEMGMETMHEGFGQDGDAIFIAFAAAHSDEVACQVDVFDAEGEEFGYAEAGTVGKLCHEACAGWHAVKESLHFVR